MAKRKTIYETTTIASAKSSASKSRADHRITMPKSDRSISLRNQIEELKEEAAMLAERAKRTARQAEILAERIKHLESQLAKKKP